MTQDFICIISFLSRSADEQQAAELKKNEDGINYVPQCHVSTLEDIGKKKKSSRSSSRKNVILLVIIYNSNRYIIYSWYLAESERN